ncbi:MAG: 6-phosphogluconolactonase [Candidatus Lokiarchaeota archaeon]|nr:6-phosphogluconolactonase [Candidatus Lokiarchaeota archaeon]
MAIKVIITDNFKELSKVAAEIIKEKIIQGLQDKSTYVLGLATGNSPTGLYKVLSQMANTNKFDSSKVRSFNLDEYIGLPGENAQQRTIHPQSYCYFMIKEFFGLLKNKFIETTLPYACLIDQKKLMQELSSHPEDWAELGTGSGKSIVIKDKASSEYLSWIQEKILEGYAQKIEKSGGIDLQVIGVGGRGHVAFHESGIPFEGSKVMLIKLDKNTVTNAVIDGQFISEDECPRYAISMGAELVYKSKTVLLLANGERKTKSVTESLLNVPTPNVPISYGQIYSEKGGNLIYVLDKIAGRELVANKNKLEQKGIEIEIRSS